ncbi:MAG: hypothetical protein DRZ76_01965 [Candidatus Nealsonbacteria bacterium]|nr:MAG: hypothetical protein DRZ76_01965 [Candidatus Nealsonbacteria bacterium]
MADIQIFKPDGTLTIQGIYGEIPKFNIHTPEGSQFYNTYRRALIKTLLQKAPLEAGSSIKEVIAAKPRHFRVVNTLTKKLNLLEKMAKRRAPYVHRHTALARTMARQIIENVGQTGYFDPRILGQYSDTATTSKISEQLLKTQDPVVLEEKIADILKKRRTGGVSIPPELTEPEYAKRLPKKAFERLPSARKSAVKQEIKYFLKTGKFSKFGSKASKEFLKAWKGIPKAGKLALIGTPLLNAIQLLLSLEGTAHAPELPLGHPSVPSGIETSLWTTHPAQIKTEALLGSFGR